MMYDCKKFTLLILSAVSNGALHCGWRSPAIRTEPPVKRATPIRQKHARKQASLPSTTRRAGFFETDGRAAVSATRGSAMKGTFRAFAASGLLVAALAGVDAAMAQKQGGTVATIRLSRTRPPERLVARRSLLRKRARRRVQAGAPTRSSRRPMLSSRACTPAKSSFIPAKSRSSAPSRVITSSNF
jgi:hypothetical protein